MKKRKEFTKEELLADLLFELEQSYINEHMQDDKGIGKIRRKYGYSL